jgi:hypothetical protein
MQLTNSLPNAKRHSRGAHMNPKAIVVLLAVLSCCGVDARAQSAIPPLVQTLVTPVSDWATQDEQTLRQALLLAGSSIESDLIAAFNAGPPASTLAAITSGDVAKFTNIQTWLSTNASGSNNGTLASILSQTPQQLAQGQANLYAFRYQSNALTYLASIAGPTGKALLASVASNSKSPFQPVAQLAMANSFADLWAAFEAGAPRGRFGIQAAAVLSPGRTLNPVNSDTIVRLGPFVALIPSGSFIAQRAGLYTFSGPVTSTGGTPVNLKVSILAVNPPPWLAKRFGDALLVDVDGSGADLGPTAPVEAGLMIGSVGGTAQAVRFGSQDEGRGRLGHWRSGEWSHH